MIFKSYIKNTEGNIATMFAVSLLTIIAATGTAIDYASLTNANSKLQSLTDSIALAAAISIKNEKLNVSKLDEFAKTYLDKSDFSEAQPVWALDKDELSLTLETSKPMIFMGIFGKDQKVVQAAARVPVYEKTDVTVALVLDTTLSMSGTRINSLQTAANELIDILTETDSNETFMSVVPFTAMVKLPVSFENEIWFDNPEDKDVSYNVVDLDLSVNCRIVVTGESKARVCDETFFRPINETIEWQGCMLSRDFGFHNVPEFTSQRFQGFVRQGYCQRGRNRLMPMTNNVADIKRTVNTMLPDGKTYIPAGLIWGWRTLQEAQPLIEIQQAPAGSQKVMVLMTDGANELSLGNEDKASTGLLHDGNNANAADALTAELCEGIKSEGIIVYTIALEVDDADTVSLMRNCATSSNHFYDLSSPEALSLAFNNIGIEVNDIRLSQ